MEVLNKKLFWCTYEECEFQFNNRKNLLQHYDEDHCNDLENEINEEIKIIQEVPKDKIETPMKTREMENEKTREIDNVKTREIDNEKTREIDIEKTREIDKEKTREISNVKTREIDNEETREIDNDSSLEQISTNKCEICQHSYLLEDKISERNNHMYDHFKNEIEEAIGKGHALKNMTCLS